MNAFALVRNALWTACLSIALVVLFSCGRSANAQSPKPIFPVASPITLPGASDPVFIGDFNGDGKPDLAYIDTISSSQSSLGIQLNFGSSAATTVTTPLCVAGAGQPSFADVNNDKKLDLVYSCNGFLTIQLGNGDGTFQAPAYFGKYIGTLVFTDLNGDGYLDIAALIPTANAPPQVAVFLNQGATAPGAFATPTLYAAPTGATGLLAGDFNGDGKQDLITTIYTSGAPGTQTASTAYSIFYGNGDGTLNGATTQSVASFYAFTAGDFNGDGVTDLAFLLASAPNTLFTSVQILLGSNSGTFSQGAALPVPVNLPAQEFPQGMAAVALTKDGNLDLLVTTNVLNVFHGDGKGGFTATGAYAFSGVGGGYLFADVNGDGNQDLIAAGPASEVFIFLGNGGSSFQAPPGAPVSGLVADVNNDGIADMVFLPALGGNYFGTALGRGDGSFAILNQSTPVPPAQTGYLLMTGDFNGDGKTDALAIQPGSVGHNALTCVAPDAQLLSYLGSGDGRFQAKGTALALEVSGAGAGATGDFNSDGNLDIILPYNCSPTGLLFLPGHGDGTFGSPVDLNVQGGNNPVPLVGDLNNDKKLDFIWNGIVFLGNGDGTFKQLPLTIPAGSGVLAIADLNGDGILDVVSGRSGTPGGGSTIYAGNGDGTFQATGFYTVPLPPYTYQYSIAVGDVNGDGNPDLLVGELQVGVAPYLGVYLGDGHGNFTQDTNTYIVNTSQSFGATPIVPVRLNNQAPPSNKDNRLDVVIPLLDRFAATSNIASLLNQTNPAPVKPAPLTSTTALQTSLATATPGAAITLTASVFGTNPTGSVSFAANGNALGTEALVNGTATLATSFANAGSYTVTATYAGDSNNTGSTSSPVGVTITPVTSATTLQATPSAGNVNGQITFKASVSGDSPTGSVSFSAGSTSLGTATLTNGVASLQTSFAAAGSYVTTATYQGDQNNAASTSSAVTIVIAAPDFTVTATPASGSVTPGQTATFTFTVNPVGGYAGTVKFSCGALPAQAACSFSPASATPSGGSPATSTLTVTTAAAMAALNPNRHSGPSLPPWVPAGGLALAGVMGFAFAPRTIGRWNRQLRLLSWGLLLASITLSVLGCGGGNSSTPATTPAGSYTISVNANDSAGGSQHAVSIALTVQ
jgi:hypothetical protein